MNSTHVVLFYTITVKRQLIEKFQFSLKTVFFCLCTFLILFRVVKNRSGLIIQREKRFLLSFFAGVSFIIMKDFSSTALENHSSFLNVIPALEAREQWLGFELAVLQLLSGAEAQQGLQRLNN